MTRKYFISMSGTFRSFVQQKITLEDLKGSSFIFGPHKETINEIMYIPWFVLSHNIEKPRWLQDLDSIDSNCVDKAVLDLWKSFMNVILESHHEDRVTWTDGNNYPSKIKPLLEAGHEVYWDGRLRKIEEFKYMSDA